MLEYQTINVALSSHAHRQQTQPALESSNETSKCMRVTRGRKSHVLHTISAPNHLIAHSTPITDAEAREPTPVGQAHAHVQDITYVNEIERCRNVLYPRYSSVRLTRVVVQYFGGNRPEQRGSLRWVALKVLHDNSARKPL